MKTSTFQHYHFELANVLKNDKGKDLFTKHCKKELNLESLEFVFAVEEYEKLLPSNKQDELQAKAKEIISEFINPNGSKEINLSNSIKAKLLQDFSNVSQTQNFAQLFTKALFATQLLLSEDVFSRFIRTPEFVALIESSSESTVNSIGGIHKSKVRQVEKEHFERKHVVQDDFDLIVHLSKDYYSWKMLSSNVKTQDAVYVGTSSIVEQAARKQFGDLHMAKVSFYVDGLSAYELFNVVFSSSYFCKIFPSIKLLEPIEHFEGSNSQYSYVVVREVMDMGPLATKRDFIYTTSGTHDPSSNTFIALARMCIHEKNPKAPKGFIRGIFYAAFYFQSVSENRCKYTQVCNLNVKGWMNSLMSDMIWKGWQKSQ